VGWLLEIEPDGLFDLVVESIADVIFHPQLHKKTKPFPALPFGRVRKGQILDDRAKNESVEGHADSHKNREKDPRY
jgi:hypothetical protein